MEFSTAKYVTQTRVSFEVFSHLGNQRGIIQANAILKIVVESTWSEVGRRNQRAPIVSDVNFGV